MPPRGFNGGQNCQPCRNAAMSTNPNRLSQTRSKYRNRGLTLVELMISVALSLFIAIALITLYLNVAQSNTELAKTNSQIEGGRFASYFLHDDLVHAGYWGTYNPRFDNLAFLNTVPTDVPTAIPDPCKSFATWTPQDQTNMIAIPLQTYETVPTTCTSLITNKVANTDILVVRHVETCSPDIAADTNCEALNNSRLYFQSSLNSGCAGAPSYPNYVLSNVAANFTLKGRNCTSNTPRRRFIQHIYYVRDFANTAGDGIPTLVRSVFDFAGSPATLAQQPAQALVEGVEGFRIELGVDNVSRTGAAVDYTQAVAFVDAAVQASPTNRGDGNTDEFVRCPGNTSCTTAQLVNVVAAKVFLLVRARDATPGFTDNKTYQLGSTSASNVTPAGSFKRHLFTNTIRLANVSGRRETP